MPDGPVVHVAGDHAVGVRTAERTAGPIGRSRIERRDRLGHDVVVVKEIAGQRVVPPFDRIHKTLHHLLFVVAAPERERRMVAQALDLVRNFGDDVLHKDRIVLGVRGAGEHEVLPDQQT